MSIKDENKNTIYLVTKRDSDYQTCPFSEIIKDTAEWIKCERKI